MASPPPSPEAARSDLEADAQHMYRTAVRSVQADRLLTPEVCADALPDDLAAATPIRVAAFGKAALAMAGQAEQHLGAERVSGLAVIPEGYRATLPDAQQAPTQIDVEDGGHPLPTEASARAGQRLLRQADACTSDDVLLVLVSGGGTALASAPAGDLDIEDLRTAYALLLGAGASIQEANVVRKHLARVGGGRLAQAAAPARVVALVVSDVPGDDLATIASGPTVPDPSTYADAMRVLYRNGLWRSVPAPVREHLAAGANGRRPETPGAAHPCFETTETRLIGSNATALRALRREAASCGYRVARVTPNVEGEARDVGARMARTVREARPDRPTCWIWGGETTVTVTGTGTGGRNQEVALGAAQELHGAERPLVVLSGGTDGIDGPTDAAGAWATPATVERAQSLGLDPAAHLQRNDAYAFFDALGTLLRPGPTHTNVMDVAIALADPAGSPVPRCSPADRHPHGTASGQR